jgi:hypothetical protein
MLRLAALLGIFWMPEASVQAQQASSDPAPGAVSQDERQTVATSSLVRLVEVSPELPPYRFVLKPDAWTNKRHPAPDEHIGQMIVFKGTSPVMEQFIEVAAVDPSWLTNSFHSIDINLDGFQDIQVVYEVAGKWGSHSYWLFDPDSGRFVTNALTADLRALRHNGLTLNPETKEIRTSHFIGVCQKSFKIHRIENGRLVLLESELHFPEAPGRCLVETRRRMNGELVLTEAREREHEVPESPSEPRTR